MATAQRLLVSKGEEVVYHRLKAFKQHLSVFPKVRFFDVFPWDIQNVNAKEHSYLEKTHFDFVICDKSPGLKPLFAVEFDGIGENYEALDPYRVLKRRLKERLCQQETFPLLWLDKLNDIEGTTILEAIVTSYIGSCDYEQLIKKGVLSWEESFIYAFPPLVRLNKKLGGYRIGQTSEVIDPQGSVKIINEFLIDDGTFKVSRGAIVRAIHFPGFHTLELAEDIAMYRCLREFEKALASGRVSTTAIDIRRRAVVACLQKQKGKQST